MLGDMVNIKVCSPLKLLSDLTGKKPAICRYSYNLALPSILTNTEHSLTICVSKMTNSNYFAIFFLSNRL